MCLYPVTITVRPKDKPRFRQTVSCGKCLQCLQEKSMEWAFRIMDESKKYPVSCFITLTYADAFLPSDGSISRRELQLFVKRLRKSLYPLKIRYFGCGEYGHLFQRPHYHLIVFGWFPDDAWFFRHQDGSDLYRSKTIEDLWRQGFVTVGKLSFNSALYCAKYMNKVDFIRNPRKDIVAPFVQMSNRPGIGYDSVYSCDLSTDKIYCNGKGIKIPRYYLKVMEKDGIFLDDFKFLRQEQGEHISSVTDIEQKRKSFYNKFLKPDKVKRKPK